MSIPIEEQLKALHEVKSFNISLHPESLVFGDELKSVPPHETVLRPLLTFASECHVFGLKTKSPIYELARPILCSKNRSSWELNRGTELIKGYERFWNAGSFQRGSVVITVPYSLECFEGIFAHCSLPIVWSGVAQLRKAHPSSAVKHCFAMQDCHETVFALSASNGIQWMDVFPPIEYLEELFLLARRVGDKTMLKPAWMWQ